MSDLAKLKTLAQMLKPLGDMIPLIEKAESCEQAVRDATTKRDRLLAECKKAETHLAECEAMSALHKQEALDLARTAKTNYDLTVDEADKEAKKIVGEASDILTKAKEQAERLVADARSRATNIDSTISEKTKELEKLEGKIAKSKEGLRKLLASADS